MEDGSAEALTHVLALGNKPSRGRAEGEVASCGLRAGLGVAWWPQQDSVTHASKVAGGLTGSHAQDSELEPMITRKPFKTFK